MNQRVKPHSDFFQGFKAAPTKIMKAVMRMLAAHQGIQEKIARTMSAKANKMTAMDVNRLTKMDNPPTALHCYERHQMRDVWSVY
jgi:hypothetical protein